MYLNHLLCKYSYRHVVSMMHYNHENQDIARPSEVLSRVQSYMASLRTLELYVNIDMTRVLTAVLLQETQSLDSKGESTVASTYTSWWVFKYPLCLDMLYVGIVYTCVKVHQYSTEESCCR